jgi:hypothetical protein
MIFSRIKGKNISEKNAMHAIHNASHYLYVPTYVRKCRTILSDIIIGEMTTEIKERLAKLDNFVILHIYFELKSSIECFK